MGGTETLVARLSRHLLSLGYDVDVLFITSSVKGAIVRLMPAEARALFVDPWRARLFPFGCRRLFSDLKGEYRHVVACSTKAIFVAKMLRDILRLKATYTFYVVNFKVFKRESLDGARTLLRDTMRNEPVNNLVFMNEECRRNWSAGLERDLSACRIVPLPVEARDRVPYRRSRPARIVSIGRIDDGLKLYNWNLIKPLKTLRDGGVDLRWHIYGGGRSDQIASLEAAIDEAGCRDFIVYEGELAYEDMERVLADTDVFVGMGTAAVEAASMGVPAVVARAYDQEPTSYGFLYELPFGNVGEEIVGRESVPIVDFMRSALTMADAEYVELREQCVQAAGEYEMGPSVERLLWRDGGVSTGEGARARLASRWAGAGWLLLRTWGRLKGAATRLAP